MRAGACELMDQDNSSIRGIVINASKTVLDTRTTKKKNKNRMETKRFPKS